MACRGRSSQGVLNALTLGLTGTAQGLFLWSVISWPSGLRGPIGNSPEFPDFLIYKMGTVLCTLQVRGLTWEALSISQGSCHKGFQEAVQ